MTTDYTAPLLGIGFLMLVVVCILSSIFHKLCDILNELQQRPGRRSHEDDGEWWKDQG